MAFIALASVLFLLVGCASPLKPPITTEPAEQSSFQETADAKPYAGLWLANAQDGGAVVRGVMAGPAAIAGMLRGDRILRIEGAGVDAARAQAMIGASSPGKRLTFDILREGKPLTIEVRIGSRKRWAGPSNHPAKIRNADIPRNEISPKPHLVIEQALSAAPDLSPVTQRLDRMFADLAQDDAGHHKLPLIRAAFSRPAELENWRDELLSRMRVPTNDRNAVIMTICKTLALTCPESLPEPASPAFTLAQFAATMSAENRNVREVFRDTEEGRAQAIADMEYLLRTVSTSQTLVGQAEDLRGIRAMQVSMRVDFSALLAVSARLLENAAHLPTPAPKLRKLPAALRVAVEGEIVDYIEIDSGYVVVGGTGGNRYDMAKLYTVIDLGGNDIYQWGNNIPLETQTVIDLQGNDRYVASRGGPAAGWLGVSILIDRAGNDHYESALGGCGAGALGVGLLFDDAGSDTYQCDAWSLGAAVYGAGVLFDRGAASDVHISHTFSQGVGGPRGFGLLLDAGGDDLYRANGSVPSIYGTPGSYMAFSQGVGVGIRPYDFGGVGVMLELGGNDRYEGGEFSQGGGYFWGIGLLHDASGNDLYYGNRYAQGFAAHQAFGMLSDMKGDDIYWSMTAAGQGAAWDQSIAILFDGEGNDVYQAESLAQGAAAQQSLAILHDVSGDDIYRAAGEDAQGAAGDNSYHFSADDPIHSLGILLDENGTDRYSTGLANGERRIRKTSSNDNGAGVAGVSTDWGTKQ
jgi:PDZ domain